MYEMVDISIKTYENNGIEVKVDGIGTLWLNEKHAEEKGGQKKKNQVIKIYQSSQTNMTQYTKSTDMNQQINQKSNQTEDFCVVIQQ